MDDRLFDGAGEDASDESIAIPTTGTVFSERVREIRLENALR
jgi:hypothetical protein